MMRAFLSVGCDVYDHLTPLSSAEFDSRSMASALSDDNISFYSRERSIVLSSPTVEDVRASLREILFDGPRLDVFTLYFAGHGVVSDGSFYMCTRDSRLGAFSATAFSLGDLFRLINEAKPWQTNIVIDACESGGLVEDLNVLLKGALYGQAGTPSVTLFAASASDQGAIETEGGGVATQCLVSYMSGRKFLRDDSPALDLLELGRRVSEDLKSLGQNPMMWGLNLYGSAQFCINPKYSATDTELRNALKDSSGADHPLADHQISALWRIHYQLPNVWIPRNLVDCLGACLEGFGANEGARALLAGAFYDAVCARVLGSTEAMLKSEVCAATLAALLPWLHEQASHELAKKICTELLEECGSLCTALTSVVSRDRLELLRHPSGGLPDLFSHPIRLSRLMAWTTLPLACNPHAAMRSESTSAASLIRALLEAYPSCMTVVCEQQASSIAIAVSSMLLHGEREIAEELLGHYFLSLVEAGGRIVADETDGRAILDCLLSRCEGVEQAFTEGAARPCETLAVVLSLARIAALNDECDPYLWQLDGASCLCFVTDAWTQFASDRIKDGNNITFVIGREVFRLSDLAELQLIVGPDCPTQRLALAATSLIFPDRVSWYLIAEISAYAGLASAGVRTLSTH